MFEFFSNLFETDFMPHGHCYFWEPAILWSHAISDGIIALAYCAIPFSLVTIFRKHHDTKFIWMMILFAVFIFGCGVTHVFDVINIWKPYYRVDSVVRVITAMASIATAVVLIKATPSILKIPSTSEWKKLNDELKLKLQEIEQKDKIIETIKNLEEFALAIPQIMFVVDKSGNINYMNEKWAEFSGDDTDEVKHLDILYQKYAHPDQPDEKRKQLKMALENQEKLEINLQLRNHEGKYKWLLLRGQPLKDAKGIRWVCTLTDVDEQIKKNQQLASTNEELTRVNNDLDNFVYTASHDLRSPINNLEGIIDVYKDEPLTDDKSKAEMWHLFSSSIARLKITINDISDIAKIQRLDPEDVDLIKFEDIYYEIREDSSLLLQTSGANIQVDFSQPSIKFSKKHLRSIMYNLISNGIKYGKPMQVPQINIATRVREEKIILEVTDYGQGIKKEHQEKIFEMFRRFNNTTDGTGLGLYIVKRILDNTGGTIEVESIEENYTTVRIIF